MTFTLTPAQQHRAAHVLDLLDGFSDGIEYARLFAGIQFIRHGAATAIPGDLIKLFASYYYGAEEAGAWRGEDGDHEREADRDIRRIMAESEALTFFAKNAKNPTCAISAQVEGTTLTGWAEHYARQARKDGPCPTCNDTGTDGETLPTGYYVEFPCGECLTRHRAAVSAEVRALIDLERGAQAEKWGGLHHDKAHTPAEWASYITYQNGMATQHPDAFKSRMIKIAALAIAAYEAMS